MDAKTLVSILRPQFPTDTVEVYEENKTLVIVSSKFQSLPQSTRESRISGILGEPTPEWNLSLWTPTEVKEFVQTGQRPDPETFDPEVVKKADPNLFQRWLSDKYVCLGCHEVGTNPNIKVFLDGQQMRGCVFAAQNGDEGIVVQRVLQQSDDLEARVIGPARWIVQTGKVEIRRE